MVDVIGEHAEGCVGGGGAAAHHHRYQQHREGSAAHATVLPMKGKKAKDSPVNGTSAIIARLMSGCGESGPDRAHEREHGPAGTARLQVWDQRGDRQVA